MGLCKLGKVAILCILAIAAILNSSEFGWTRVGQGVIGSEGVAVVICCMLVMVTTLCTLAMGAILDLAGFEQTAMQLESIRCGRAAVVVKTVV